MAQAGRDVKAAARMRLTLGWNDQHLHDPLIKKSA
jgi:hypothetical protein